MTHNQDENTADSEQDKPNKTGPKPKELTTGTIVGLVVGRNKVVIPPESVQELAELGCTNRDIARFYGITESTLTYNFRDNLTIGREEVKMSLRRAMLRNAIVNHQPTVQIFLAKNMLGMSDNGPTSGDGDGILPWKD